MMNDNFVSNERVMQISTRVCKDPDFETNRSSAIDLIRKSKDFNEKEKLIVLSLLNKIDRSQSFENKYIGFN